MLNKDIRLPSRVTVQKSSGHKIHPFGWWTLVAIGILLLAACSRTPSVQDQPTGPPAAVESKAKSTEFVVLIDNSRSISPPEQIIIREATLLLADLADIGDRLSVITFGENARLVTSRQLQGDSDRLAFKNDVRQGVNFTEKLSDIRAGLRLLVQDRSRLVPDGGRHPCRRPVQRWQVGTQKYLPPGSFAATADGSQRTAGG